jgi:hypothetical protein
LAGFVVSFSVEQKASLPAPARHGANDAFSPNHPFRLKLPCRKVDNRPRTGVQDPALADQRARPIPKVQGRTAETRIIAGHFRDDLFMQSKRFNLRPHYEFTKSSPIAPIQPEVTAELGEILPILADALAHDRAWLADFKKDPITISRDLHEILLAYKAFRRAAT